MLEAIFDTLIRKPFYSKIYTETWENIADGGPTCYKELTVQFRTIITIIMTIVQYCVLKYSLGEVRRKYGQKKESPEKVKPHIMEIFLGWISIIIFCTQIWYKFSAGKGIFLLNPCHVVLLMEAYVLLLDKTEKTQVMYANCVSNFFSPWCGIMFAVNIGLDGPFEKEMYWVEHYLSAIINPLALSLSGRYHERKFFDFYYRLIGFAFFSLYHRVVLFPLSLATWANLDQILCHADTDPFWHIFGDWYYLMGDFYIPLASNLIAYGYLITCEIIAWSKSLVQKKLKYAKLYAKEIKVE
jgi:hypothetical protein